MPTIIQRKLLHQEELFHVNMVAIPYFHSTKPTNVLVMKRVDMNLMQKYDCRMMTKLYYKNNKPIMSKIVTFESVQKAQQCRQAILTHYNNNLQDTTQKDSTIKINHTCEFAKEITNLSNTLYFSQKHYCTHPQTKQLKHLIDTTSQLVVMGGFEVEEKLRQLQQPMLQFLNETVLSLEHEYYRWRVYSYMQGDGEGRYRMESFAMVENGHVWYPPLMLSAQQQQGSSLQSSQTTTIPYPCILNFKQIKHFTQALEKMQRKKYAIQELMIFAIHNINCAVHIAAIIMVKMYEVLMLSKGEVIGGGSTGGDVVSILYLISDILFNSTNHIYRDLFQSQLPKVVYQYVLMRQQQQQSQFTQSLIQSDNKLFAEMKKLFTLWQKKFIFDENFMKGLLFMLELVDLKRLYQLTEYTEHKRIMEIKGCENVEYQLQRCCKENGLPYFQGKKEEAKVFLNALFWENDKSLDVEPGLGKYDGEQITEKEMQKIQSKGIKVVSCQNLPLLILYDKNWKSFTFKGSLSQDGQ